MSMSKHASAYVPALRPACVVAWLSGYVDAYTVLTFGVHSSFMSGNTTEAGVHAAGHELSVAAYYFLPLPCFVIGVMAGTLEVVS